MKHVLLPCGAVHAGNTVAEALSAWSRDDGIDLNDSEREQLLSLVTSAVAHKTGSQQPNASAAAAAAAGSASSSAQASTVSTQQQQQQQQQQQPYPPPAAFAAAIQFTASNEDGKTSGEEITAFFCATFKYKLAGEQQRQRSAQELQRAAVNVITGLGSWNLGLKAMAAGTLHCCVATEFRPVLCTFECRCNMCVLSAKCLL
jgi:hypothetical protein